MNTSILLTVYLKELRDSLRDRRTLLSIVLIPTVVMPLLAMTTLKIGMEVVTKARQEVPSVMILGAAHSPKVVGELRAWAKVRIVGNSPDWKQQIADKRLRAAVLIPDDFDSELREGRGGDVVIYNYSGEIKSGFATSELSGFFDDLRRSTVRERLLSRGLPEALVSPFETKKENVAPPEKVGGNAVGGFVPYLVIILCFTGAMYPAMDLTAGEKERGTMETLLCSPAGRTEIVLGKFLMVLTGSLSAMVLAMVSLCLTFLAGGALLFNGAPANAPAGDMAGLGSIDPLGIFGTLAMVVPVSVLISAVLFSLSLFARSFKEAQSYVSPLIVIVLLPTMIGLLPGVDLNARIALVPILNLSLVCKEMLSGVWHWGYIALIFGSSCLYAAVALGIAVRMFNRESVIFRA